MSPRLPRSVRPIAIAIAIDIKERVSAETGLTVSVGLGSGKTVAKIASDLQKPDGLVVVPTGQEADFLAPLAVGKLVGVGPKSAARLHDEGVVTIGQLAAMPEAWFARHFGKRGDSIRNRARGIDHDPVQTSREAKSISAETTFRRGPSGQLGGRARGAAGHRGAAVGAGRPLPARQGPGGPHRHRQAAPLRLHHLHPPDHAAVTHRRRSGHRRHRMDAAGTRAGSRPRLSPPGRGRLPASPKRRAPTKRRSPWSPSNG